MESGHEFLALEGNRIVNISLTAEWLINNTVCKQCKQGTLRVTQETRFGFASKLYWICDQCGTVSTLHTSHKNTGTKKYDINTRFVTAMKTSSIGGSYKFCETWAAHCDIPTPSRETFFSESKDVGTVMQKAAQKSVNNALQGCCLLYCCSFIEEIKQTQHNGVTVDGNGLIPIKYSFDVQWDKPRGFNSLIGGRAAIGTLTGKVIDYGVKVKKCGVCQHATQLEIVPPKHQCYCNHSGSAKSMESAIAVDIANDIRTKGATTQQIITDEDASIIKNLKEKAEGGINIEKGSDANHLKKIFVKDLAKLKKDPTLPFKQQKGVLSKVQRVQIGTYFYRCIEKHHQQPEVLKKAFQRMVDHIWGRHCECENWCSSRKQWFKTVMNTLITAKQIKTSEVIPSLKLLAMKTLLIHKVNWKERLVVDIQEEIQAVLTAINVVENAMLSGQLLREKIESIVARFSTDDMLQKLKDGGSTQKNEALHSVHSGLGGKRVFWGRSSSANDSWSGAVLRINHGRTFTSEIYEEMDKPIGKYQQIGLDRWKHEEEYHTKMKQSTKYKDSRKRLREERSAESKAKEKSEGIQYKSGIGLEQPTKKRRTKAQVPATQWLHCTIQGCDKCFISKNGLNNHKKKHLNDVK